MKDGGIISQYGFLFQRYVFLLFSLQNISMSNNVIFEGKDDIEVSNDDKIFSMLGLKGQNIQVKSGVVGKESFSKIICNWMIIEDYESSIFELFTENELNFEFRSSEMASYIYKYILEGKNKNKSAIAKKAYDKFIEVNKLDESNLNKIIKNILSDFKLSQFSIDNVRDTTIDLFEQTYCSDIVNFSVAKIKRFERFEGYLNLRLDEALKKKNSFLLQFSEFIKLIIQVTDEINDKRYTVDLKPLKKKLEPKAKEIVMNRKLREVNQLNIVEENESFIIENIVCELIYKDYRSVYDEVKSIEVSNWEQEAWENYHMSSIFLSKDTYSPKELYLSTISKPIESNLLPKGTIYGKGCYVYLTSNEVDEEIQITWGDENEIR